MEKMTYEKAMEKLEKIVGQLESGNLPLEKSMTLFEEANKLAFFCKSCLDSAEQKIVQLMGDGTEADYDE